MFKKRIVNLCLVLGLVLGMAAADGWRPGGSVEAEEGGKSTITVSGRGEVVIKPDVAYIQIGLLTQGKTAKEAHDANARQFAEINKALRELKVAAKDIQTVRFTTYPQYEWIKEKNELVGYQVEQIVRVTYRDIDQIGMLLDKVMAAGANRVESIQYTTEKWEAYQLEALQKAMDNARAKADLLAKKAGVTLKGVASISESIANPPYATSHLYFDRAVAESKAADAQTQVHPGEIKIEAQVTVSYSF